MSTTPEPIVVAGLLQQVLDHYDAKAEDLPEYKLSGALDEAAKARPPLSEDAWRGYSKNGAPP